MKIVFAIDLLWVRYGKIGGGVAVAINLLDGLMTLEDDFETYLIVTKDNRKLFSKYCRNKRFKLVVVNEVSRHRWKTVLLQNFYLSEIVKAHKISVCLEPDNYMPLVNRGGIDYITVIHDLQAIHFPENFSRMKLLWLKMNWINAFKYSRKLVSISEYTRKDIIRHFKINKDKMVVIYAPVVNNLDKVADFSYVGSLFGVEENRFYYTVSSLGKNKNLNTLLDMMVVLRKRGFSGKKLVITGIGSRKEREAFIKIAASKRIEDNVILTGFIDNNTRNALYKACEVFLFPSIFEGFGMPPIEAGLFGARVLTTFEASLPEITQNAFCYVKDPLDAVEWADAVLNIKEQNHKSLNYDLYNISTIAKQYLDVIKDVFN